MTITKQSFCVKCGGKITDSDTNTEPARCEICDREYPNYETEQPNTEQTRREVLKMFGAGAGAVAGFGKNHSAVHPTRENQSDIRQGEGRPAYVMLPALSTTTLLANLPLLLNNPSGPSPIILMDVHDYKRLRGSALDVNTTSWRMNRAMGYDELRRRGILQLIDYTDYYSAEDQEQYVRQNQALAAEAPAWVDQKAAVHAIDFWTHYARGGYLGPFRKSLGEDPSSFNDFQEMEAEQRSAINRGCGDPTAWITQIFNQYTAALAVRDHVDRNSNLKAKFVIGEGESAIIDGYLDAAGIQRLVGPSTESLDLGSGILNADVSHLTDFEPGIRIRRIDTEDAIKTRETLDIVGDIATDIAETQHNDWSLLGSTVALPQNNDLFDLIDIRKQIRNEVDEETLIKEATEAVNTLKAETGTDQTTNKVRYDAERLAEERDLTPVEQNQITRRMDYAVDLLDHSRELRVLHEQGDISQAAAFVGASIVSDPVRRYNEDEAYNRGIELIRRLDPPSLDESDINAFQRHGEENDWYETLDRNR